jgi:DNA primase
MSDGRQARFLFLREGEDPDSMVRQDGPEAFLDLVEKAQPLEEFLFACQAEGLDLATMEGRAGLSKRALALIRQLPEGVFRELMVQSLAERTGIELESLRRLEVPPPAPPAPEPAPPGWMAGDNAPPPDESYAPPEDHEDHGPRQRTPLDRQPSAHATLTQAAIALLLHKPSISRLAEEGSLDHLEGSEGALLRDVLALLHKRPESSTGMLLGHWHGSDEGELLARLAGQERLIPAEGIEAQFTDILRRLTSLPLRQRISSEIDALKGRPYGQLSDDDKLRLGELIRSLRDLDKRSGPRGTDDI